MVSTRYVTPPFEARACARAPQGDGFYKHLVSRHPEVRGHRARVYPSSAVSKRKSTRVDLRARASKDEGANHTITLPSSVIASSTLSPASPRIISLWARPEGIIGKQFSVLSTLQSNSTGFFTLIISWIAASKSPRLVQRKPTAP